jgi:hypothetical protein
MSRLDLIIDALEDMCGGRCNAEYNPCQARVALAAAHELKALKPVGYMDKNGILFNDTTHPHLNTPLYALDEMTK